ncbi:MAG TPA: hypothetical protein VKB94_00100, partial [Rhizomicrobium sp.]|nr:hypothetical protein [Rhizomicrobium sp.]
MKFVNIASLSATAFTALMGLFTVPASAGVITYDFTLDQCSNGGCGLTNYGSVTVSDIGGGGVTVHLSLLNGSGLVDTGALDNHSLIFNLAGAPAVTITGLPTFWTYAATS